jgi:nicotinamide-nucleotide amidase
LTPRPRAAIVVTGSELVRGERNDLNGPFYAQQALALGLDPIGIAIVGDDPFELERAVREGLAADVCLVSGGLGPTHDDRTVEIVAKVLGRELRLDEELEQEIGDRSRTYAERQRVPYSDFAAGVVKQATVPEGATVLGLSGTAPGLVIAGDSCVVVVLPGPPTELQALWPRAIVSAPLAHVLSGTKPPEKRVLRFYGVSESTVARTLADAGGDGNGVDVTICARDFEIHLDLVIEDGAEQRADALAEALTTSLSHCLFARTEETIQELVLELCRERGYTVGTAESCTGGLVAARLTTVAGSSDVFRGAIVAYANSVKEAELCVPAEVLAAHGAVSAEAAAAMAAGARERLGVDVVVAITGVAGPGGGTAEKPVGLVFFHAIAPHGEQAVSFEMPGERDVVRARAAVAALHLLWRLLTQSRHTRD